MTEATSTDDGRDAQDRCWCCGKEHPPTNLLRLNSHPEVTVCLDCAAYLARRAQQRRDRLRPSRAGRARDAVRSARRGVIDRGWHELPLLGRVLRWLDRFLP